MMRTRHRSLWGEPIDYLRWELRQIQEARQETRRLLTTCPPEHRDTYCAALEQWDARAQAKEEHIAAEMAPRPTMTPSQWLAQYQLEPEPANERAHVIPRSLAEAERMEVDGDPGALGRLFDRENRRERFYGHAY